MLNKRFQFLQSLRLLLFLLRGAVSLRIARNSQLRLSCAHTIRAGAFSHSSENTQNAHARRRAANSANRDRVSIKQSSIARYKFHRLLAAQSKTIARRCDFVCILAICGQRSHGTNQQWHARSVHTKQHI